MSQLFLSALMDGIIKDLSPGEQQTMRQEIHPEYHQVKAVCVCGGTIETGSVLADIRLDICSNCHPFYTGTQKIVDTEGRVEKFKKRFANATPKKGKA